MRPRLHRYSALRHRPEHLSHRLRRGTQLVLKDHLSAFIQYAIPTPSIPKIQSHRVFLLRKDSGLLACHSDTLPHSRSPLFIAPRARLSLGAYRIPPGDRHSHPICLSHMRNRGLTRGLRQSIMLAREELICYAFTFPATCPSQTISRKLLSSSPSFLWGRRCSTYHPNPDGKGSRRRTGVSTFSCRKNRKRRVNRSPSTA